MSAERSDTYLNPVYPHSFPDPFVLKCKDGYFAYCTGFANSEDEVFPVLSSRDLITWTTLGFAMRPLAEAPPYYWAPEVSYWNGLYYLYYSTGNEILMEIRVAVSQRPDGGFVDAGHRLTPQDFAVDPHVFTDSDGRRYLFYATDFLAHSHIGTGTVVDRLVGPFTLEGRPRPVTRAKYDWQVYDAARKEKGGVRWHTVEGPSILKRKGTYFQMFSGGNWQNTTYGVSFSTTRSIVANEEWEQYSDGDKVLPLLRTVTGEVIGPGHNSIVHGPNNRELYCVYHRWTDAGRVMAIDRMDVVGKRLFVRGPTTGPQPTPFEPKVIRADGTTPGMSFATPQSFLLEFSLRCSSDAGDGDVGFIVNNDEMRLSVLNGDRPPDFDLSVFHDFRIEIDGRCFLLLIDGWFTAFETVLDSDVTRLTVYDEKERAEFGRFELTPGFEDLFDSDADSLVTRGWRLEGFGNVQHGDGEIAINSIAGETVMGREMQFHGVDFAANLRRESSGTFGIRLTSSAGLAAELAIGRQARLAAGSREVRVSLPAGWEPDELHQYELLAANGRIIAYLEHVQLAQLPFNEQVVSPAIFCRECDIAVEMAHATAI